MAEITPKIYNNPSLDQPQVSANTPYGQPADKENEVGKTLADVRDKFAKKAEIPTTASANVGELDLPAILKKVDPNNLSSILPSMFQQLSKVNSVLNASAPSSRKLVIQDSLTGALYRLSNKYGFTIVIQSMYKVLDNNGLLSIDSSFWSVVENAIANLIQAVMEYGNNIPITPLPSIVYGEAIPSPLVTNPPDLSTKQYYTPETDPFPGYIQWLTSSFSYVYIKRGDTDYPFSSMEEETKILGEISLANTMDFYVSNNTLTAVLLNTFLLLQDSYIETTNMNYNIGSGSGSNLSSLAPQILGEIGSAVNTLTSSLANTVLSSTSISSALDDFTKNMSVLKKMKDDASSIIQVASSLSNIPNVSSVISSSNIPPAAITAVQGVLNKLGIS